MTPLSKRLILALAISGALNLLAIGLFVGGMIRRSHWHGGPTHLEHLERGPRGDRPRGVDPEQLVVRRRATAAARRAVREALEHEPFEAAALERSLGALRGETAATQELLHRSLLDAATQGDAEKRRGLARRFARLSERTP